MFSANQLIGFFDDDTYCPCKYYCRRRPGDDTDDDWRGGKTKKREEIKKRGGRRRGTPPRGSDTWIVLEPAKKKTIIEQCEEIKDFNVSIYDPVDGARTIILGDIHADLEALRYCLRYCAKVIDGDDNWIGKATNVVLVGDMIDRARRSANTGLPNSRNRLAYMDMATVVDKDADYRGVGEIVNEEIIIQKLLNKLSLEAIKYGGRIIKILGNHEISHLDQLGSDWVFRYSTNLGLMNESPGFSPDIFSNYEEKSEDLFKAIGENRLKNYAPEAISSGLLMGCGGRMIVKIGKWIIIHGGIVPALIDKIYQIFSIDKDDPTRGKQFLEKANDLLRKKYKNELDRSVSSTDQKAWKKYVDDKEGLVWDRSLSGDKSFREDFCQSEGRLETIFKLLGFSSDSRIVVAHSPQKDYSLFDTGVSWSLLPSVEEFDADAIIFGPAGPNGPGGVRCNYNDLPPHFGRNLDDKCPKIPGITYQCPDENGIGQIWRVDVAMSRGFDLFAEMAHANGRGMIEAYWEGRKPQVLEVIHHDEKSELDEVRVIKSKKSLPRDDALFEIYIETIYHTPEDNAKQYWSTIKPEPEQKMDTDVDDMVTG